MVCGIGDQLRESRISIVPKQKHSGNIGDKSKNKVHLWNVVVDKNGDVANEVDLAGKPTGSGSCETTNPNPDRVKDQTRTRQSQSFAKTDRSKLGLVQRA